MAEHEAAMPRLAQVAWMLRRYRRGCISPGVCVHCSVSHLLGLLSQSAFMEIETPIKICFSMACINDLVRLFELY